MANFLDFKGMRWRWIILWLVIFWPVGLFLLIRKMTADKSVLMSGKTRPLIVVAWVLIVVGVVGILGSFDTSSDSSGTESPAGTIILGLSMIAGGVILLRTASKTKKTATKYKKYIDLVVNQDIRSMDYIASATGLSYDIVMKDLQDMINIGYLKDAHIHQGNREIVWGYDDEPELQNYTQATTADAKQAAPPKKAVRCSGCGANNVVAIGRVSECEYCGTPITA